jgi:hypothetical protein
VPHASGTLLSDRFTSNLHVWQAERNDAAHAAIRDGSYDLRVLSASIGQTDTRLLHDAAAVVVDADLRELRPGRASGVACLSAGGDGFLAEVSGATGRYAIWAQQGTEGTRIGAGHSAAVRSTGVNHLSLHCGASGGEVSLSVNGHVVADVRGGQTVDAYTQAQLVVESGRHTADTQFDNVVVRAVP